MRLLDEQYTLLRGTADDGLAAVGTNCKRGSVQSWHVPCGTHAGFTVIGHIAATVPILERGMLLLTLRFPVRRWGPRHRQ